MLATALVTPFRDGPDREAYSRLVGFVLEQGAHAVLVAGATGEGASLGEDERDALLDAALGAAAQALPDARLLPHAAPGRTGTELLPDDLARLAEACSNVVGVLDSTGRLARMERVRALCGERLSLLCGDDVLLRDAMIDPHIRADGGCVATAQLAPAAVRELHDACLALNAVRARELQDALSLLHGLQSVTAEESVTVGGEALLVPQRARNPVPLKSALAMLGLALPVWRAPLAALGPNGAARVRTALRLTDRRHPELLAPLAEAFGVDLAACLDAAAEQATTQGSGPAGGSAASPAASPAIRTASGPARGKPSGRASGRTQEAR
jgi:4-hydroxy-tetrahydrodipicolinate synthase